MKTKLVTVDSIKSPIKDSPGFEKKELATHKLDIMALCGAGCGYCSSNDGNYLRMRRKAFADATEAQLGERLYPATSPELSIRWGDFEERLDEQLKNKPRLWGLGHTLVFSQLTDAFSPWAVKEGLTLRTLTKIMNQTAFRVRILTKFDYVGRRAWVECLKQFPSSRLVVGLSIGTLDDEWARRVEIGTSSPSARLRALHRLQDAGIATYGMLCPIFPDVLGGDGVERLVAAIRPERCETVWSEPFNDRNNWETIAAGYPTDTSDGKATHFLLRSMFEGAGARAAWSGYAVALYERVHRALGAEAHKHRYLLYQDGMTEQAREAMRGAPGVLFQSAEKKKPEVVSAA